MSDQDHGKKPRSVAQLTDTEPRLGGAVRQAQAFRSLNDRVASALPETHRDHIRIASIEGDCLMIGAESPTWATQARLWADTMVSEASALWPLPVRRSQIFVDPRAFLLERGDL